MSTDTIPPLSKWRVDFDGLYTRHLGRHSQFGINVAHLIALYGVWFGIYAAIGQAAYLVAAPAVAWILGTLALAYLAAVSLNAPGRVTLATAAFLTLFVASVMAVPKLPLWSIPLFLALIPVFYKVQAYSHRIWTDAADMSEFNKRFPPGRELNLILLIYEVPICLDYLVFHRHDWKR